MKLSTITQAAWSPQRVVVFGDAKTGKTELVGKLAEEFHLWFFDLENGSVVLRKLPAAWQENIELFKIPDTRTYPIAIETMRKVTTGHQLLICRLHGKVNCPLIPCKGHSEESPQADKICLRDFGSKDVLIMDSGTQLGNSAINAIIRLQEEDYKPGWEDYRKQGTLLDGVLSAFQQAWYHVCMICHTTQARMEDESKTKLVPVCGTDNFSRNVAKYFDHVVYCEIGTGTHKFGSKTTYRPQILTGSRTDQTIESMAIASLLPFFRGEIFKPAEAKTAADLALAAAKVSSLQGIKKS